MQLSRIKDEFLFTIESTGILSPEELFKEALKVCGDVVILELQTPYVSNKVLTSKCEAVAAALQGGEGDE